MAEDIKAKGKKFQTAPLTAAFPTRTRPGTAGRTPRTSTMLRRQCLLQAVMSPCANGVCISPSAPYPGCWPQTTTRQKACFLGKSELAAPHLSSILILLPGR